MHHIYRGIYQYIYPLSLIPLGGGIGIVEAWRLDNPLVTWKFNARRDELKRALGRPPDELQGFHGTHPDNVVSICRDDPPTIVQR